MHIIEYKVADIHLWPKHTHRTFTMEGVVLGERGRSLTSGQLTECSWTFSESWETRVSLSGRSGSSSSVSTTRLSRSTEHREDCVGGRGIGRRGWGGGGGGGGGGIREGKEGGGGGRLVGGVRDGG